MCRTPCGHKGVQDRQSLPHWLYSLTHRIQINQWAAKIEEIQILCRLKSQASWGIRYGFLNGLTILAQRRLFFHPPKPQKVNVKAGGEWRMKRGDVHRLLERVIDTLPQKKPPYVLVDIICCVHALYFTFTSKTFSKRSVQRTFVFHAYFQPVYSPPHWIMLHFKTLQLPVEGLWTIVDITALCRMHCHSWQNAAWKLLRGLSLLALGGPFLFLAVIIRYLCWFNLYRLRNYPIESV